MILSALLAITLPLCVTGLIQRIKRRTRLEPRDLLCRDAVVRLDGERVAIRLVDCYLHRLARRQTVQPRHADAVLLLDLLVILRISKGQRQDPLLLQISFMDARKTLRDDNPHIQEPGRHGGMFSAAALAVVLVADHNRPDALALVSPGNLGDGQPRLSREYIRALAWLG